MVGPKKFQTQAIRSNSFTYSSLFLANLQFRTVQIKTRFRETAPTLLIVSLLMEIT